MYVKTAQGWRFKRRQFIPSLSSPQPAYQGPTFSTPVKIPGATAKGSPLTPADYLEIQQLVARYPYGLDTGAETGYMYANVFTPDGVFVTPVRKIEGREALKGFAWQHRPGQGPLYSRNFSTNVQITPSPEGATGRIFALVLDIGEGGKPSTIIGGGHYEDAYVRTPNGWRIKSRQFIDNQIGPPPAEKAQPERTRHTEPVPLVRAKDPNAIRLTAQDYVEIQQLATRYSHALDAGFENGYAYADLFTHDGAAFDRWIGREQISEIPRTGSRQPLGPNYVRHFAMNHLIEPTATGAIGKQYVVVIDLSRDGKPASIFLGGQYQDVYVKTPQGWRFKTRTEFRSGYTAANTVR